jgi:hypothetical protein
VLVARWLGLPATAGCRFLLDTATLNILIDQRARCGRAAATGVDTTSDGRRTRIA